VAPQNITVIECRSRRPRYDL